MRTISFHVFLGLIFGYILGRGGVAEFSHVKGMFLLEDFHMYGVLGTAVPLAGLLIVWMEKRKVKSVDGEPINVPRRRRHPGNLPGGVLFGAGWALTGACPGTSLVQVATGHLLAFATVAGILVGVGFYPVIHRRFFDWVPDSC